MQTPKPTQVHATTGIATSRYGTENPYLVVRVTAHDLGAFRTRAAATYRAAARVHERIGTASDCAVCVDVHEGRIHLEFGERAQRPEQDAAFEALNAVAEELNREHA